MVCNDTDTIEMFNRGYGRNRLEREAVPSEIRFWLIS